MQNRTFIRTMLDILLNNPVAKTVIAFVNFCNEQRYYNQKELKFLKKMPIEKLKHESYESRYLFTSVAAIKSGMK